MSTTEQTILRHQVLQQMDTGGSFDLVFITADRRRGTGGKIKRVKNWQKICGQRGEARLPAHLATRVNTSKNPEHSTHKTVNIYDPRHAMQDVTKVHWRLMVYFNNKRIID